MGAYRGTSFPQGLTSYFVFSFHLTPSFVFRVLLRVFALILSLEERGLEMVEGKVVDVETVGYGKIHSIEFVSAFIPSIAFISLTFKVSLTSLDGKTDAEAIGAG